MTVGLVELSPEIWEALVDRIAALEATNAALVETVAATDAYEKQREVVIRDKTNVDAWDELDRLWRRYQDARQTLATDHGTPLPGEGVEG